MFIKYLFFSVMVVWVDSIRVCDNYFSYLYDPGNKNCRDNPDNIDLPGLVTQHNYQLTTHKVTTGDGYILQVFNLRKENPKGVVFLQHPAGASCTAWLDKGNASLAYALFHAGYDVWLGNFRGTFYSRAHEKLNPNHKAYWNFSYHEMGIYDIPAQLNLVKKQTNANKITYIGYSMGCTAGVIYASMLPDHSEANVNKFILLAPPVFLGHLQAPIKVLAPFEKILLTIFDEFGLMELVPHNEMTLRIFGFCRTYPGVYLCPLVTQYFMSGVNETNINIAYIPVGFSQFPAGLGAKCLAHYGQNINGGGRFAQFDYGDKNEEHYHSKISPEYPIHNIRNKMFMMSGTKDELCTEIDIENFHNKLPPAAKDKLYVVEGYTHYDFGTAINLAEVINPTVIQEVNRASTI